MPLAWDPADDPGAPRHIDSPYPFCSTNGGEEGAFVSHCRYGEFHVWNSLDLPGQAACVCDVPCSSDDECPDPGSGTAVPSCVPNDDGEGGCWLPCNEGETCPDGMQCAPAWDQGSFCGYLETDAEYAHVMHDLDCGTYTTREDCERELREAERQPLNGCVWAKETISAASGDSCGAVQSDLERCVEGEFIGGMFEPDPAPVSNRCSSDSPPLYWDDLGAGTLSLIQVYSDFYEPAVIDSFDSSEWRRFAPCEFGDIAIPLACECGC